MPHLGFWRYVWGALHYPTGRIRAGSSRPWTCCRCGDGTWAVPLQEPLLLLPAAPKNLKSTPKPVQKGSSPFPPGQAETSVDWGNLHHRDGGQTLLPHPTAIPLRFDCISFTAVGANFCKTEEKRKQNRRDFHLFAAAFLFFFHCSFDFSSLFAPASRGGWILLLCLGAWQGMGHSVESWDHRIVESKNCRMVESLNCWIVEL